MSMNYKLLFQLEAEQNKLLQKKLLEYERVIRDMQITQDTSKQAGEEALVELTEYKETMTDITNRITSYTKDLKLDIKA